MYWFDGHLDLAYLAQRGRDMRANPRAIREETGPVAVTFPALAQGRIRRAIASVFVQPRGGDSQDQAVDGPWCYDTPAEAFAASLAQLEIYRRWHADGTLRFAPGAHGTVPEPSADRPDAASRQPLRKQNDVVPSRSGDLEPPLEVMLLLEGAAGVRSPEDLHTFYSRGVRILALSWVGGTSWAGGDQSGGDVTPAGRRLLAQADQLAMVHDVSHLSEAAFWKVMECAGRPKIASHSNCRALLTAARHPERHLSDQQIRALADAGGMIGINLYSHFLANRRPAQVADVVRHVCHVLDTTGRDDGIGLGSDMDGGFSADELPAPIRGPADLARLGEALHRAGLSDRQIEGFAFGNWERFFRRAGMPWDEQED
jgi:membrane dipeptidase